MRRKLLISLIPLTLLMIILSGVLVVADAKEKDNEFHRDGQFQYASEPHYTSWGLPCLRTPVGVNYAGGGGGTITEASGYSYKRTEFKVVTGFSIDKLHECYKEQLEQFDWTLDEQGGNDVVIWSNWSFASPQSDNCHGTLTILRGGEGDWLDIQQCLPVKPTLIRNEEGDWLAVQLYVPVTWQITR
ncbi:MAG: hypothetical protein ACLFPU_07430 [Dehalococcoidia bacterium]